MDVGAGSGDVNQKAAMVGSKGHQAEYYLGRYDKEACDEAKRLFTNEPRIQVRRADVRDLPDASADIVTGSQFIHHFQGGGWWRW